MTAICPGGGPSQIKPGVQPLQTFLASDLADFMVTKGMGWGAAIAAGIGILSFDLTTLCVADPPTLPNVDAARIAGYFNPVNPLGASQLRDDFTAILGHFLWNDLCQCVSGTAPTPTPISQPSGWTPSNPNVLVPTGTPCFAFGRAIVGTSLPDANGNWFAPMQGGGNAPPGGQWVQIQTNGGNSSPQGEMRPVTYTFNFLDANNVQVGSVTDTQGLDRPFGVAFFTSAPWPSTATHITTQAHSSHTPAVNWDYISEGHLYCTAMPPNVEQPCCPPDPILMQLIAQVLRTEQQILDELNGLGGPKGPYVDQAVHTNLSGEGLISIDPSSVAVRLEVTSSLEQWPHNPQTPTYYFSLGFITPFAVGTPLRGQRLIYSGQTLAWPTYTDAIGYTLTPGITANLVELAIAPST